MNLSENDSKDKTLASKVSFHRQDLTRLSKEELIDQVLSLHAQLESKESEALNGEANLRAILDHNENGIWSIDKNLKVIDFNKSLAEEVFRHKKIRVKRGQNVLLCIPEEDVRHHWKKRYLEVFHKKKSSSFLDVHLYKGKEEYFEINMFPIFSRGEVTALAIFAVNVSEREKNKKNLNSKNTLMKAVNKATEILITNEDMGSSITETLPIIGNASSSCRAYVVSREYENDGRIRYRLCSSWKKDESIAKLDRGFMEQFLFDNANNSDCLTVMSSGQRIKGKRKEFDEGFQKFLKVLNVKAVLWVPIRVKNQFWGFIGFDICEKNEIWSDFEAELLTNFANALGAFISRQQVTDELKEQNEELNKVNKELDRFVYSASHDLRTPLSSLLGLINIAKNEKHIEDIRFCLNLQEKSVNRLDNLIKDIIHYSRNTRLEVDKNACELKETISEVFEQFEFEEHAVNIEKIIKINQKERLYTDLGRLKIILNNIISNAVRYRDSDKKKPYIMVDVYVSKDRAHFEISDNGKGIKEEFLDKIFDMFYRASESGQGTGLGLYIVKETIEKLSGTIKVTSRFGQGTSFTLEIPNLLMEVV